METVKIEYLGGLRTECVHVKSGTKIMTDAPTDNKGKVKSFHQLIWWRPLMEPAWFR